MANFDIGISGLDAAQKALVVIGNNIANAATEGYHRQRINFTPAFFTEVGSVLLGGGVNTTEVTRMIDNLLEQEILRQHSSLEQVSQEYTTLRSVENAFGEFSTSGGLSAAIDNFFNALDDLCTNPTGGIQQNQAVTAAEALSVQFRTLGEYLTTLESQIRLEAENIIEEVNILINEIAELNDDIESREMAGGQANNLRDQRDQCITKLSEYIGVETINRDHGVVDVTAGAIPVVIGSFAIELEVGLQTDGSLGIAIANTSNYKTDVEGGRLGGLLSLKNELISDIHDDLDSLASAMIQQINQYHVQGVGSAGSFTELTGWANISGDLSDFSTVSAGYVYIRVTNTSSGAVARTAIPVLQDTSSDTLTEIASYITNNVANVTASANSSNQLTITADTGYKFDFLPAVLPQPTASTLTGSPPTISVSGIYTGTSNDTFEFTVVGTGSVSNGALELEVKDNGGAGSVIATLNVGSGYAAGDTLDIGNGIKISLSTGNLNNAETFQVDAFADTDTSGMLAAVGINTFFSGNTASTIGVCSDISATPGRIATAFGADMTDNTNASQMAGLRDQAITSLNSMTPGEFYHRLVTDTGQQLFIKQMRQENIEAIVQNLANQRSEVSGVDINDEAIQLLIFEQMFAAMAKYISTIESTLSSVMEIL